MRNIPPNRPALPSGTVKKLVAKAGDVASAADPKAKAQTLYASARTTKWFGPVVDALKQMASPGGACMYCSSNEPSEVDHFRPKSHFPEDTFRYENLVWSCSVCNRHKDERFPPLTEQGHMIVNPIDDDVWEHFMMDPKFGRLVPAWDVASGGLDARARSTCEIVQVDRQLIQDRRQQRLRELREEASDLLEAYAAGQKTVATVAAALDQWRAGVLQPDVADYFLNGPGRSTEPFQSLVQIAGASGGPQT